MKTNKFKVLIIALCAFLLSSCMNVELEPHEKVKEYFRALDSGDFQAAYQYYHPELQEKIPFEEYVSNIKTGQEKDGKIQLILLKRMKVTDPDNYYFTIQTFQDRQANLLVIRMIKQNEQWYIGGFKAIGGKKIDFDVIKEQNPESLENGRVIYKS